MPFDTKKIVECYTCGLFIKKDIQIGISLKCPRCNSNLSKDKEHTIDALYYAISSLLLFIILNIYPLITLSFGISKLDTTLIGTVIILLEQNFFLLALIIFFTIIVAPIFNSIIIIITFIQKYTKIRLFTNIFLHDAFYFLKNWVFIEVFIISVVIAYIKLVGMVSSTQFDLGFYIMIVYLFCFYMSNTKFEGKNVLGE